MLDNVLIVADRIRRVQPIWFSKLVEELPNLSPADISHSLDTLFDWGIIYGEYGETRPDHAGRLFKIYPEAEQMIEGYSRIRCRVKI